MRNPANLLPELICNNPVFLIKCLLYNHQNNNTYDFDMSAEHREPCKILKSKQLESVSEHLQARLHHLELLLEKNIHSKGHRLEKLWNEKHGNHFYSIRLNHKARVILTKVKHQWLMLDILENHEYHMCHSLKSGKIYQILSEELERHQIELDHSELPSLSPIEIEYFNENLIILNPQQENARTSTLPMIVSGMPGSGKSCIAMAILNQFIELITAGKKVLYITHSRKLVQYMQQNWLNSPTCDDTNRDSIHFSTYHDLFLKQNSEAFIADENHFYEWIKTSKFNTI
jgi:hypothetical protein